LEQDKESWTKQIINTPKPDAKELSKVKKSG
jgi:hypothetical protein